MITEKEFNVLTTIESANQKISQREISKINDYSVGTVNSICTSLTERGLITENKITTYGLEVLAPFKVKRVIFLAAGFGSRLMPITLNTPKPLVRIKGIRIIDTMIDACIAADIKEIIIVRGYLSEQFDQLLYKYPNITFLENPAYNESNNISSALCARYMMGNSYICEADIFLKNPRLIRKYQYKSNYYGVPCESTDDWCLYENKGRISGVTVGGTDGYRMLGISYWTETDGRKLANCLDKAYNQPGGKERYWDSVPLSIFNRDFDLSVKKCRFEDFDEIDTLNELKTLDSIYDI